MFRKRKKVRTKARLVYYNFGDGPDDEKLDDLDYAEGIGADVIAVSEHADRVDVTSRFIKKHPEYNRYYGDGRNGAAKECLLWKKSLGEVTLEKTITLVGARRLEKGAGPEAAGPKCAHRVRLRRNGRRLHLIVGHQYATVNNRREAAWDFIRALSNVVRSRVGTVLFFGDLNAELKDATVRAFKALFTGSSAPKSGDTHKKRLIDYIMVRGGKILSAFTEKRSSDHKMLIVDVMI